MYKSNFTRQKEQHDQTLQRAIVYTLGYCEARIEITAKSLGLSFPELTSGVAHALLASTSGEGMGTQHYMPSLRGSGTTLGKTAREMEVDGSSHRKTQTG